MDLCFQNLIGICFGLSEQLLEGTPRTGSKKNFVYSQNWLQGLRVNSRTGLRTLSGVRELTSRTPSRLQKLALRTPSRLRVEFENWLWEFRGLWVESKNWLWGLRVDSERIPRIEDLFSTSRQYYIIKLIITKISWIKNNNLKPSIIQLTTNNARVIHSHKAVNKYCATIIAGLTLQNKG